MDASQDVRFGPLLRIISLARKTSLWLVVLCITALVSAVVITVSDVIYRAIAGKSIPGVIEICGSLMPVIAFLALASTQLEKKHINVMVLTQHFSSRLQLALGLMALVVALGLVIVGVWQSSEGFYDAWKIKEYSIGFLEFPTWPAKIFMLIGLAALALQLVADLIEQAFIKIPKK